MTTASTALPARPAARVLLDAYRPGAGTAFLAGPHRTLLAEGERLAVPHGPEPVHVRVARALRDAAARPGAEPPVVVGAVPFDAAAPAPLYVPARVRRAGPLAPAAPGLDDDAQAYAAAPGPAGSAQSGWRVRPVPEPARYEAAVAAAVARLAAGGLDKVVLARTLELTSAAPAPLPRLLRRLALRDPRGYTFAVPAGPGRTLIGASPELLVSRTGTRLTANPLAGSAPRSTDLAEDVCRAAALLHSPKDLHEHAVVVRAVRAALAPYCRTLHVPDEPTLVRTAAMWHLSTVVTGELADPATTSLEVAAALHPTPAVCGTPTAAARRLIGELEPFDRGLYTGMVGWADARGDGEWVVSLRCAEASDARPGSLLRLFAGAGIIAGSEPAAERAETAAKFRTFLAAAGIEGAA